jgi:hypothetical protein
MKKSEVLQVIQEYYKFEKDTEFAKFLGISSQVLSNWKSRNTYDVKIIYTKCVEFSPEWLLTGKEPMLKEEAIVAKSLEEILFSKKNPNNDYILNLQQKFIATLEQKIKDQHTEIEQLKKELSTTTSGKAIIAVKQ